MSGLLLRRYNGLDWEPFMTATEYPHIEIGLDGLAYIHDTTTKIVEIVMDRLAWHWDADQIQRQHPHLSLAQVHSAFAFYYDHQAELDQQIEDRRRREDEIFSRIGDSPLRKKLQALKQQLEQQST